MVTWVVTQYVYSADSNRQNRLYREGYCLSTDTKPTEDMANGSLLIEMDTSAAYAYDEEGDEWITQS